VSDNEKVAKLFHDTYERLAPQYGYKTRDETAVAWEDVPWPNKALMIAVAATVREYVVNVEVARLIAERVEAVYGPEPVSEPEK
jgi:cupin superfamily acireductone dioxygenase involved in methionine salvage